MDEQTHQCWEKAVKHIKQSLFTLSRIWWEATENGHISKTYEGTWDNGK